MTFLNPLKRMLSDGQTSSLLGENVGKQWSWTINLHLEQRLFVWSAVPYTSYVYTLSQWSYVEISDQHMQAPLQNNIKTVNITSLA
jgi:hypothetical protein